MTCRSGDANKTVLKWQSASFLEQVLPEKEARVITAQVVQGLAYLNEAPRHIIHYDLKPANILFDTFGQAKITVRPTSRLRPLCSFCPAHMEVVAIADGEIHL
jgi:serine/threonine protein kinase